jgi:hypothetical protein
VASGCRQSPLLEEHDAPELRETVGAVGQRLLDRISIGLGEGDDRVSVVVGVFERAGRVVEPHRSKTKREIEHETVWNLKACEQHGDSILCVRGASCGRPDRRAYSRALQAIAPRRGGGGNSLRATLTDDGCTYEGDTSPDTGRFTIDLEDEDREPGLLATRERDRAHAAQPRTSAGAVRSERRSYNSPVREATTPDCWTAGLRRETRRSSAAVAAPVPSCTGRPVSDPTARFGRGYSLDGPGSVGADERRTSSRSVSTTA